MFPPLFLLIVAAAVTWACADAWVRRGLTAAVNAAWRYA